MFLAACPMAVGLAAPKTPDLKILEEVTVTAHRPIDQHTLEHEIVPQFVQSHAGASERIDQIGRWYENICPEVSGLEPLAGEYVSRRIVELARNAGAPTRNAGKCTTNIEVVVTPQPRELLAHIASKYPVLLGYSRFPKKLREFSHTVQAWYVTGSRTFITLHSVDIRQTLPPASAGGLQVDSDKEVLGEAGSRLGRSSRSEFVHVLIIADSKPLAAYPLRAVADYIAMLALTRAGLEGCNPLPSITDLLSGECGERSKPAEATSADLAYLKALYSSRLERNLNVERGEVRDQMLSALEH
ncbi:MAG TPA: hypothetical protein VLW26_13150 [Steroidobacteraceae bacterium]|nr:hypothetical protein [Steroidobacteraceae bacterium]